MRKQTFQKVLLLLIGLFSAGLFLFASKAAAAAPTTVNFQGKVVNNTTGNIGTNISDSSYSVIFRLYSTTSPTTTGSCTVGNNCLWEETDSVSTVNGVFQVELGNNCSFFTPASCNNSTALDFSSNSLYLTMKFNGDSAGFMSPAIHFTGVPYAYYASNSAALGGLVAGNFVQLAQGLQTDTSTTNASIAINKNNSSGTPNILQLQKAGSNVLVLDNNGFLALSPAANLTSGQTHIAETITNASVSGGTIQGLSQTLTVSNTTSGATTYGTSISLTDNTSLSNTNTGLKVSLSGSNGSQIAVGIDSTVAAGIAVRGQSSTATGFESCGATGGIAMGVCGVYTGNNTFGTGVYGESRGAGVLVSSNIAGVAGSSTSLGAASNYYVGVTGSTFQSNAAAYTSVGVYGKATAGAGATTYGGYFDLGVSGSTAGAALFATNSTNTANILQLQDGTTPLNVLTVADGGVTTFKSNSSSGIIVQDSSSSKTVLTVDTSGDQVLLGQAGASGLNGTLVFNNAAGAHTVGLSLQADPASSYTLLLPTTGPSTSQCLQTDSTTANQLRFATCSSATALSINSAAVGSSANFVDTASTSAVAGIAYSNSSGTISTSISNADGTHAGALTASTQTIGGDKTFKSASNSATAFQIQDNSNNVLLNVDASTLAINIGATGATTFGSTTHIADTSNASGTQAVKVGSNANSSNTVDLDAGTGVSGIEIGDTTTAHGIKIGAGGAAAGSAQTVVIGSNTTTTASIVTLQGGNITTSNSNAGIVIGGGFSTSDTNLVPLILDSTTTFAETGSTCTASVNGGAMYFNETTGAIRACVLSSNSTAGWEDLVSTAGLGIIAFGVVPDSPVNLGSQGDLAGLGASGANGSGPCKVYLGSGAGPKSIRWTGCVAYSGGRRVVVVPQTTDLTLTTTASSWAHVCLNGTNNQPTVSAFGTENAAANLPAFSANNPILCLADISTGTGQANITGIYDTRTFTTSTHDFVNISTATSVGLGTIVIPSTTNTVTAGASATANVQGVVVAWGGATTGTPNAIIATAGPTWAKATGGTAGAVVIPSATAGRVATGTSVAGPYGDLGIQRSATWSATCTAGTASTCQTAIFFDLLLR